ncbi:hypothetical protein NQZ68_020579 [Dissostichus eleginoides]|nr:hypothetical protein NQZ68_020579 [Dissostichus eleginoides]
MSLESLDYWIHLFIPKLEVKQTPDEAVAASQHSEQSGNNRKLTAGNALFATSGALFFDCQHSSLPRTVAAFLPAISDCQPPCQNRGSCSRPQTCVCRSGFQGPRCEEVAPEQVYIRDGGALRRVQPGTNPFQRDQPRRRPSERQAIDTTKVQTPRPATTRLPSAQQETEQGRAGCVRSEQVISPKVISPSSLLHNHTKDSWQPLPENRDVHLGKFSYYTTWQSAILLKEDVSRIVLLSPFSAAAKTEEACRWGAGAEVEKRSEVQVCGFGTSVLLWVNRVQTQLWRPAVLRAKRVPGVLGFLLGQREQRTIENSTLSVGQICLSHSPSPLSKAPSETRSLGRSASGLSIQSQILLIRRACADAAVGGTNTAGQLEEEGRLSHYALQPLVQEQMERASIRLHSQIWGMALAATGRIPGRSSRHREHDLIQPQWLER